MASDDSLHQRIVEAAIAAYREADFSTVDRRVLAERAGISVAAIDETFSDWEHLVVAVIDRWSGASRRALVTVGESEGAVAYLRALLRKADQDRPLVRMRMAVLSAASDPSRATGQWFRSEYVRFTRDVAQFLTRDVIVGREPRTTNPEHAAEQLIALYEGMQAQSILLDGADLLVSWDRAVARMRMGWSRPYEPES
jgi:AcrR family transcriptional regulator